MRTSTSLLCALTALAPSAASAESGGPDAFGYTWIDSFEVGGPAFAPLGANDDLMLTDEDEVGLPLPFMFDFYGVSETHVTAGANGAILFELIGEVDFLNACPLTADPESMVALLWDDLDPASGGAVKTQVHGSAPNRIYVVEWEDVPPYSSSLGTFTGEIQLHESDNHIELHYTDVFFGDPTYDLGASATVGIRGATSVLEVSCNVSLLSDGLAIAFWPPLGPCMDGDGDGWTDCAGDCDDSDPMTSPGAPESCDGADNDCDGAVPPDEADGDGDSWMVCNGDCDDGDPSSWPGALELCDAIDNDRDWTVPADEADGDGDSWMVCEGDCDDSAAAVNPGATEAGVGPCADGIDNDCDGWVDSTDDGCPPGDDDDVAPDDDDLVPDDDDLVPDDDDLVPDDDDVAPDDDDVAPDDDDSAPDDDDSAPDDDDSAPDDDDSALDDDDSAPDDDDDAQTWELGPGCQVSCGTSARADPVVLAGLLLVLLALSGRRRWPLPRGSGGLSGGGGRPLGLVLVLALTAALAFPAEAWADAPEEAARQVEMAKADLAAGRYDLAIGACDSALRLDPGLREAFKVKGLALERLGRLDDARSMLLAYETLRAGLPPDPEVQSVLERIDAARAPGSEELGRILVYAADPVRAEASVRRKVGRDAQLVVREVTGSLTDGGVWFIGLDVSGMCPVASVSAADVAARLARGQAQIDELDVEAGLAALTGLRQTLGCLDEPIDPSVLWTLHFVEGVASYYERGVGAAGPAFARALAIGPGEAFDDSYPPELRDGYLDIQSRIMTSGRAHLLSTTDDGAAPGAVWIDGLPVTGRGSSVLLGEHLLQFRDVDGALRGGVIRVGAGDVVAIGDPDRFSESLERLELSQQKVLADWLAEHAGLAAGTRVWLQDSRGRSSLLGASRSPTGGGSGAPARADGTRLLLLGLGGGYQRTRDWDYVSLAIDISVRLVGPLRIELFARPAVGEVARSAAGDRHPDGVRPILATFGLGPVLLFDLPVRPRIGAHLQLAPNPDGTGGAPRFLVGAAGSLGVEIPLGRSPLAIRPVVEVGVLGPLFSLRGMAELTVGLGP